MKLSSVEPELTSLCPTCGGLVQQSGRGRPRRFCSTKCNKQQTNRRRRRRQLPLKNPTLKTCAHCGTEFLAKNRARIYCYDNWCAQAAYQKRKRIGETRRVVDHTVDCDNCGASFIARHPLARWCSKQCANRYWGRIRSRQVLTTSTADYTDRAIFERDRWVCHICRKPVDRNASRTSPMGATIDHLIPITQGGEDTARNVATAHYACNVRKGTSAMNDQLRLIG